MNFSNDKAIYVQIAERLSDEILAGKYKEDERIPSVREYAVLLEVNANTTVNRGAGRIGRASFAAARELNVEFRDLLTKELTFVATL